MNILIICRGVCDGLIRAPKLNDKDYFQALAEMSVPFCVV